MNEYIHKLMNTCQKKSPGHIVRRICVKDQVLKRDDSPPELSTVVRCNRIPGVRLTTDKAVAGGQCCFLQDKVDVG
jgi:hypothetical protein